MTRMTMVNGIVNLFVVQTVQRPQCTPMKKVKNHYFFMVSVQFETGCIMEWI